VLLMQPFVPALNKSKFALHHSKVAQGAVGVRLFWVKRTGGVRSPRQPGTAYRKTGGEMKNGADERS